jgi:hypothetical protein
MKEENKEMCVLDFVLGMVTLGIIEFLIILGLNCIIKDAGESDPLGFKEDGEPPAPY